MSKAHALVEFRDGEYTIQDLESANGTRSTARRPSVRVLEPGDRIEVGDVELTFLDAGARRACAGGRGRRAGGSKVVRLALTATVTLVLMVGLLFTLIGGPGGTRGQPTGRPRKRWRRRRRNCWRSSRPRPQSSPVVKEVVQYATLAGVAAGQGAP